MDYMYIINFKISYNQDWKCLNSGQQLQLLQENLPQQMNEK